MLEATEMVVDEEENTITFTSPKTIKDENVKVYEKFEDVSKDDWYVSGLSHLVQLGVINGVDKDTFAPEYYVSRAQFVTMLARASDVDLTHFRGKSSFSDVDVKAWYAPQVEWAYKEGLIKGRDDSHFCPDGFLTREEAAVLTNRYAEENESQVLKENQYELNDDAKEELSSMEMHELESALACPEFVDEKSISNWAEDAVDVLSSAGIMNGNEKYEFMPQQFLRRSECVKLLSNYIMSDKKPTIIFPGGSYIEYLGTKEVDVSEEELMELGIPIEQEGINLHGPKLYYEDTKNNGQEKDWGGDKVILAWQSTGHKTITDKAMTLLKNDRKYIYDKMGEKVGQNASDRRTGIAWIKYFSWYTDVIERGNEVAPGIYSYVSHFYDPDYGRSYMPNTTENNAYRKFNDHFYNAYTSYRKGGEKNKYLAYKEVGMSIHYLEDLNNCFHASNRHAAVSNHVAYEEWVDSNVVKDCSTVMTYQAYRYTYDSTFKAMADNFARLAKNGYFTCIGFNSNKAKEVTAARNQTMEDIKRTERAVCGILNRFYYLGYLNH